jgi:hypothetical protein
VKVLEGIDGVLSGVVAEEAVNGEP